MTGLELRVIEMHKIAPTKTAAVAPRAPVIEFGGERGTRTLDPGIMSAVL
jgi:hypothetical protein